MKQVPLKCGHCGKYLQSWTPTFHPEEGDCIYIHFGEHYNMLCDTCVEILEQKWIDHATTEQLLSAVNYSWSCAFVAHEYQVKLASTEAL